MWFKVLHQVPRLSRLCRERVNHASYGIAQDQRSISLWLRRATTRDSSLVVRRDESFAINPLRMTASHAKLCTAPFAEGNISTLRQSLRVAMPVRWHVLQQETYAQEMLRHSIHRSLAVVILSGLTWQANVRSKPTRPP